MISLKVINLFEKEPTKKTCTRKANLVGEKREEKARRLKYYNFLYYIKIYKF